MITVRRGGSEPLIGFGNIQPAVIERKDGSLVAYMREMGFRVEFAFVSH